MCGVLHNLVHETSSLVKSPYHRLFAWTYLSVWLPLSGGFLLRIKWKSNWSGSEKHGSHLELLRSTQVELKLPKFLIKSLQWLLVTYRQSSFVRGKLNSVLIPQWAVNHSIDRRHAAEGLECASGCGAFQEAKEEGMEAKMSFIFTVYNHRGIVNRDSLLHI